MEPGCRLFYYKQIKYHVMKKKSITPYFIGLALIAALVFYLGYNLFLGENDWFYFHAIWASIFLLIALAGFIILFRFIVKNTRSWKE